MGRDVLGASFHRTHPELGSGKHSPPGVQPFSHPPHLHKEAKPWDRGCLLPLPPGPYAWSDHVRPHLGAQDPSDGRLRAARVVTPSVREWTWACAGVLCLSGAGPCTACSGSEVLLSDRLGASIPPTGLQAHLTCHSPCRSLSLLSCRAGTSQRPPQGRREQSQRPAQVRLVLSCSARCVCVCVALGPPCCVVLSRGQVWVLCCGDGPEQACQAPLPRPQTVRPGSQPLRAPQRHRPPPRQGSNQDQSPPGTQGVGVLNLLFVGNSRRSRKRGREREETDRQAKQDWHGGEGGVGTPTQTPARLRGR